MARSARTPRDAAMVRLLAHTGLRVAEAVGLEARDLDGRWLTVRRETAKGKKARMVPLNAAASEAAATLLREPPAGEEGPGRPLLRGRSGRRLTRRAVQGVVYALGDAIGRHVHVHLLRHHFVTELLNRGVPIHQARDLAGHSSTSTTSLYAHSQPDDLIRAVEKL